MFGSPDDVDTMLEGWKSIIWANMDPNIQFGLLSDFKDAPHEVMEEIAKSESGRPGHHVPECQISGNGVDNFFSVPPPGYGMNRNACGWEGTQTRQNFGFQRPAQGWSARTIYPDAGIHLPGSPRSGAPCPLRHYARL